ncbi:unnamed protein product [Caenorhabditis auriculariae]|uniref:Secreted protein n=1 Tax=Caenorhabditis auriculariae TaxID=2777116 RepID=A0A8S1GRC0_9PELO|nr:unnamed protein product [Caenorhabditis auriculariae]
MLLRWAPCISILILIIMIHEGFGCAPTRDPMGEETTDTTDDPTEESTTPFDISSTTEEDSSSTTDIPIGKLLEILLF